MSVQRKAIIAVLLLCSIFFGYKFVSVHQKISQERDAFYELQQAAQRGFEKTDIEAAPTVDRRTATDVTEAPEAKNDLEATEAPETTEAPEATKKLEATGDPKATEVSENQETTNLDETPTILPQYQELSRLNAELMGWLYLPGCEIDYPVMYTPDDPEKYLHRDFYGADSFTGVPFLDANTTVDGGVFLVYGHNMANGTMFGQLKKYKNASFWEQNPDIRFDTLYTSNTYHIFAAARIVLGVSSNQFAYYSYHDLQDEVVFDEFVSRTKEEAYYDTGITPRWGEEILMLSTCGNADNERTVIFACREK